MRIYPVRARELSAEHQRIWSEIQDSESAFENPFFRPEFTMLAASVWDRVSVGVIEERGTPVGFFPFERYLFGMGRPVAPMVSDWQGVVVRSGVEWSAEEVLRGCRLADMEFNHLVASQRQLKPYHVRIGTSPTMDLSGGYEAYKKGRREAGSALQTLERKYRKLEREVGPVRVDIDSGDPALLEWVVQQKSRQCAEKGYTDALTVPGIRRFVNAVHAAHTPGFGGMLSVLYVGDRIAAAHMGMRSKSVWHYWFPVYDESLGKYSPGLLLLMRMAQAAPEMGIRKIDLGKGDSVYKERLSNSSLELAEAHVKVRSMGSALARTLDRARDRLRRASWSGPVRRLYRRFVYR